jgi:hypothetical protein
MEKFSVDYNNRLFVCTESPDSSGLIEVDAVIDLYSDAKEEWYNEADPILNGFKFPIRVIGGDATVGDQIIEPYFFLLYNWQIRPYEEDHILQMTGNLFVDGGGNPFVPTVGDFTVMINQLTTITRVEAGGGWSEAQRDLLLALHRNKMITDPDTGVLTIYDSDGVTPLVSGNIFEDKAGLVPYRGKGAERREKLE